LAQPLANPCLGRQPKARVATSLHFLNFQEHTLNIKLQIVIPLSQFKTMNAKDLTQKSIEKFIA
jgi:hypothetical protein